MNTLILEELFDFYEIKKYEKFQSFIDTIEQSDNSYNFKKGLFPDNLSLANKRRNILKTLNTKQVNNHSIDTAKPQDLADCLKKNYKNKLQYLKKNKPLYDSYKDALKNMDLITQIYHKLEYLQVLELNKDENNFYQNEIDSSIKTLEEKINHFQNPITKKILLDFSKNKSYSFEDKIQKIYK